MRCSHNTSKFALKTFQIYNGVNVLIGKTLRSFHKNKSTCQRVKLRQVKVENAKRFKIKDVLDLLQGCVLM